MDELMKLFASKNVSSGPNDIVGERSRILKFSMHHQDQSMESSSNEREGVHLHILEDR